MESIQVPDDVSLTKSLGVIVFLNVAAGCFVAARIVANCSRGDKWKLFADDILSLVALILLSCYSGVTYAFETPSVGLKLTSIPTTTSNYLLHVHISQNMVLTTISAFAMYFSKTPILILYVRIFGIKRWLRTTSYAILVLSFILFLTTSIIVDVTCSRKVASEDEIYLLETCLETTISVGIANGLVAVLTDIIIILLPLPVISGLHLPLREKVGIAIVFLTGIFAIAASAISLSFKSLSFTGHSKSLIVTLFCTVIECSLAIMVGCVPGVRACWSSYKKSSFHKRVKLAISKPRPTKSPKENEEEDESSAQCSLT